MNFLQGLHGVVAIVLLCGLLFAEEAGVPLPFAPGELVLLAGALLIASGGLDPLVFIPLAMLACGTGSFVGYSWARAVGERGLTSLAGRLHQQKNLDRVSNRVRSAGWIGVGVCRLIPGLRIYTSLVAGAVGVSRRTFLAALVPSTIVWVGFYVSLGLAVGLPVEHVLDQLQKLALQGGILIAMGVGGFFAIRRTPPSTGAGLARLPRPLRALMAAAIDVGIVASIMTGLLAVGRRLFGIGLGEGWIDGVSAVVVAGVAYVVIARRGAGATVGESLMHTSYVSGRHVPLRPQDALRAARDVLARPPDELRPTADLLRALADPGRLRLVHNLLDQPQSAEELATLAGIDVLEAQRQLDRLQDSGLVVTQGVGEETRSRVRPELVTPLLEFLSAVDGVNAGAVESDGNGAVVSAPTSR